MNISRDEALKAVDDIFNYCEEIDNSLPENEKSGYQMLPDIQKIRKYIIENTRPHGKWEYATHYARRFRVCSVCKAEKEDDRSTGWNFCQYCESDNRPKEGEAE